MNAKKAAAKVPEIRYRLLRDKIAAYGLHTFELANVLGICQATFSHKLTGKVPWRQDEMYELMDHLHIDYGSMDLYFPRDGVESNAKRKHSLRAYLQKENKAVVSASALETLNTLVEKMYREAN